MLTSPLELLIGSANECGPYSYAERPGEAGCAAPLNMESRPQLSKPEAWISIRQYSYSPLTVLKLKTLFCDTVKFTGPTQASAWLIPVTPSEGFQSTLTLY
jgi:hypothetical protein